MKNRMLFRRSLAALAVTALIASCPWAAAAQTVNGQARAAQATVSGLTGSTTTGLADTGTLSGPGDARDASQTTGAIASMVSGEALHAATIASGGQVDSESSMAAVTVTAGGTTIGAGFAMARARSASDAEWGTATITGLSVNGVPMPITDAANQSIPVPGGTLVVNEQQQSAAGLVVNALHLVISGVADVVVASASASAR